MTVGECGEQGVAMITIYIDADACPVKQEVYRVAERHACKSVCCCKGLSL